MRGVEEATPDYPQNSDIFPIEVRPDWMKEDAVINSIPRSTIAKVISQNQMTVAIKKQIALKEEKASKSKGGLQKDEEVKMVTVTSGEDNATDVLHSQRFAFRTPLTKPEKYWDLHLVKWPEVNKRIYLSHLGLDHIISAKPENLSTTEETQ